MCESKGWEEEKEEPVGGTSIDMENIYIEPDGVLFFAD